jgi:hypothetical protein
VGGLIVMVAFGSRRMHKFKGEYRLGVLLTDGG